MDPRPPRPTLFPYTTLFRSHGIGIVVLVIAGFAQSMSQVPMSAILLRASDEQFRGRVMGIRMLAIYGNLPGLLRSEEHTSELQSQSNLVCRLLLEKKKINKT